MTKLTKREYTKRKTELEGTLDAVKLSLVVLNNDLEQLPSADERNAFCEANGERWNKLHDQERQLEQDLHSLDMEFSRSNWNGQDYALVELVFQNID